MPYLSENRKKELTTFPERANTPGDYNYLYTVAILTIWNANPRYTTIDLLEDQIEESTLPEIIRVTHELLNIGIPEKKYKKAYRLAYKEFYLRIGQHYEREKRNENGDLIEYEAAMKHLNEMSRANFDKRIGFKEKNVNEKV